MLNKAQTQLIIDISEVNLEHGQTVTSRTGPQVSFQL
jgi:hypothetical protein